MFKTMLSLIGIVSMSLVCCLNRAMTQEIVCGNIDIRNSVENFNKLQNCTVVEGYVQIVLIDNGTPKDYENLTFPALREITDYLLLFRAMGLPSLGKLFPNLSVIRGRNLFHDFALVVYEMLHLQQLGLRNLTDIVRGAVRIEKNPNLCFVETIDWDRIAKSAKNGHYIHDNKARKECPVCHKNCKDGFRTPDGKSFIGDQEGRLCWNSQHDSCQRLCDDCEKQNLSCSGTGQCCSRKCMGGCFDNHTCIACRNFFHDGQCHDKCPKKTFQYLGRRCVTEMECYSISAEYYNKNDKFLKAIDGMCTPDCPPGKSENSHNRHACDDCPKDRPCPKICPSTQVTNIASAQSLRGCTKINGSLEIYIQSGGSNVIRELEENLQQLEEISGFLKVARSFPLITLNFLKKLRLIKGEQLERNQYSFIVLDNPNLQDLWVWDSPITGPKPLTIKNGKIFFHINPKLCLNKIEDMNKYADIVGYPSPWDEHDVSKHTNGDKVACDVNELTVNIWRISPEMVGIKFQNFKLVMDDQRSLLGYLIYYKESPYNNVSIFDGRDACSTNSWKVDDYEASAENEDNWHIHIIPGLKPFTQYALYIKTYTIASETKGAQSPIIYFKTQQDTPSQPRKLSARSQSPSEIIIEWEEPSRPNGEVTHYLVTGIRDAQESQETLLSERNFCLEPITLEREKVPEEPILENNCTQTNLWVNKTSAKDKKDDEDCCSCKPTPVDDLEVERRISFEDHLINSIYIKKNLIKDDKLSKRRRREIPKNNNNNNGIKLHFSTESTESNRTEKSSSPTPDTNILHMFSKKVSLRLASIGNLTHFTEYTIEVRACQDRNHNLTIDFCSLKAMTSVRTLPKAGADDIDESSIYWETDSTDNNTESQGIRIRWAEPSDPNGIIVSYHLEYKKVSSDSHYTPPHCITRDLYLRNNGHVLQDLSPGNYSLSLRAHSLAGWSNWTQLKYFTVKDRSSPFSFLIYIVVPVAAVVSISFVILTGVLYIKYKKNQAVLDYVSVNPEYMSAGVAYEPDPFWEVPREKIQLGKELGQGSFGMVYEGIFTKEKDSLKCAVKTVNEHATARERIDFLKEADVMKSFDDCHHVIKLLGIVSVGHPVFVLMEIMSNGDLRTYLRSHRPDSEEHPNAVPPTLPQLLQMAIEIADGMAYLASRKFVHRDLAARNCMVAEDLTVKIGDFGMTRDIYETDYYRKGGKGLLPVRWMAPESLKDGVFTTYSDVWSYGVVLWEMATLASQPYQGLSNEAVLKYVVDGGKMERPENCPQKLWDLMSICWSRSPKHRPNFIEVIEMFLLNDTNESFLKLSYYSKFKSQQKQKSSSQSLNDEPSAPLNQTSNALDREENLVDITDNSKVHFFPLSRTIVPDVSESRPLSEDDNYDIDQIDEYSNADRLLGDTAVEKTNCEHRSHNNTDNNVDNSAKNSSNSNSNCNSKQSTDGSKGSKISSTTSNGSIANGHALHYKTTTC